MGAALPADVSTGAAAATDADEAWLAPLRLRWQRLRLPNGLLVLVHEDRREARVLLSVTYRVGSKDEPTGQTGFAHLFEHLMFGGSANFPGPYVERLQKAGAMDVNAVTSRDLTRYHQTVPSGMLDFALFAEADRMGHFAESLTQQVLDLQRQVVLMEKQQTEGQPLGGLQQLVGQTLYPIGHPYHHPVIGSVNDIAGATLADAQAWCARHYTPNNAVLVLAGDIDFASASERVAHHFAHIPPGPPLVRPGPWIPPTPRQRRTVVEARITEPGMLLMVWHAPASDDTAGEMLGLAAALLGGGAASRLHRELVESRRLASRVSAEAVSETVAGQFSVFVALVEGADVREAERAVREVVDAFLREPIGAVEFEGMRAQQFAGLQHSLTQIEAKAALLEAGLLQRRDPDAYLGAVRRLRDATPQRLQQACVAWLGGPANVFEIEPFGMPVAQGSGPSRAQPPAITGSTPTFDDAPLQRHVLDNGLQVEGGPLLGETRFHLRLSFGRGYLAEPTEARGAMAALGAVHRFGVGARDAAALAEHLSAQALSLAVSHDPTGFSIDIGGLERGATAALQLLVELLTATRLDPATFDRYRVEETARLDRLLADPGTRMGSRVHEQLYGAGHALLRPPALLRAGLQTLTQPAVEALRDRLFDPRDACLSWAGSLAFGVALVNALPPALSAWAGRGERLASGGEPVSPIAADGSAEVVLVDLPDSEQATLNAAIVVPAWGEVDELALLALNHALGGAFGSRLNLSVREQHGWSYGIGSGLEDHGVPGLPRLLRIQAALDAGHAADAIREIRLQMRALAETSPMTEDELADFRRRELQRLQALRRSPNAWCGALDFRHRRGLPDAYWADRAAALQAVQLPAVHALASRLLDPAAGCWVMGGNAAALHAQLSAASLPARKPLSEARRGR